MGEWRRSGYGPSLRTDEFRESGKPVSELDAARQWRAHGSEVVVSQLRDNDQNATPSAARPVDSKNADRGPLLIIAGDSDNTVPLAITEASYKIQSKNPGITEIERIKGRGHSLVIDHGWNEVADAALAFVKRFV